MSRWMIVVLSVGLIGCASEATSRAPVALAAANGIEFPSSIAQGGLVLGLAIGATNISRRSLYPIVLLLYAIPQVVLLPLFTLGFGIGPAAKIAFSCCWDCAGPASRAAARSIHFIV